MAGLFAFFTNEKTSFDRVVSPQTKSWRPDSGISTPRNLPRPPRETTCHFVMVIPTDSKILAFVLISRRNDELSSRYEKLTGSRFSFDQKPAAALLVGEELTEEEEIARLLEAVQDEHDLDYMGVAPSQTSKGLAVLKDPPKLSEADEVRLLMEQAAHENSLPKVRFLPFFSDVLDLNFNLQSHLPKTNY